MKTNSLRTLGALFVLSATIGATGCANSNFRSVSASILSSTGVISQERAEALMDAGGQAAEGFNSLDEQQEYFLGRGVAATVLDRYRPYRNAAMNKYVNKVGNVVAAYSDRPAVFKGYHFMVLDTEELNAISAPGGFIFVTKGLVKIMPDEDALAAVLAHEMGHIVLGHGLKAIKQSHLTKALTILGKEAASSAGGENVRGLTVAFGDSITDMVGTIIDKGYSRSQEYDADEYAAKLLKKVGYNPNGLLVMLAKIDAKEASGSDSGGLLSTHPDASDRISNVKGDVGSVTEELPNQAVRAQRFRAAVKPAA